MIYGQIANVSKPVSRIALGLGNVKSDDSDRVFGLLDTFTERGGTVIDTASVYAGGLSEAYIGRWLEDRGCFDTVVVTTKGGHPSLPDWTPRLNPEAVESDLTSSLERLRQDCVDVYMLHRDDERIPPDEMLEMLSTHVLSGRAKAIGVSNWSYERIEAANVYADRKGLPRISASSPQYSLAIPDTPTLPGVVTLGGARDAKEWYRVNQMPVLAWSSLAHGFFSQPMHAKVEADGSANAFATEANFERYKRSQVIGERRACSASQIALAWLLAQPINVYPVVGPGTIEHLNECLDSLDIKLSADEVSWLSLD